MAKQKIITVDGTPIRYYEQKNEDFVSLTDIAKKFNEKSGQIISNWLRSKSTVNFLGAWEKLYNQSFNVLEFENIRNMTGDNTFVLTVTGWVSETQAIGIRAKTGRYGGTYAHKDIAFEFLSYLSPTFKLYVFKEFQRLKLEEAEQQKKTLQWEMKRTLAKVNYRIHTDAVKQYLIPPRVQKTKGEGIYYASEADLLNVALFGETAKQWRSQNPDLKGNMRDYATSEQLLVLSNLENLNAEFIKQKLAQDERLQKLNEIAIHQMSLLVDMPKIKGLDDK